MSSLSGAYDLSSLKKGPDASATPAATSAQSTSRIAVAALVQNCTEQTLKAVLDLSASVPVILEFHADSVRAMEISDRLRAAVENLDGRLVLARIDAQIEQRVGQAFGIKGAPTVVAVVKGQPVPLFEGEQSAEVIEQIFARVLEVASENGVTGQAEVSAEEVEVQLPPLHQKAFELIETEDYDGAIDVYEQALRENPRDDLAMAGLAQVKLLKRTADADFEKVSDQPPTGLDELLAWADIQVSTSSVKVAFDALLDAFEQRFDDRETIRKHIVELFAVIDPANADLAAARRRLATLLY
jgi:putative thioredoxin